MRINKVPAKRGYWKMMRPMGVEAQWDDTAGKYKLYTSYTKEMSGDDVGAWFTFDSTVSETIEVSMGVSFVSIENARLNLEKEQPFGTTFDKLRAEARKMWNDDLSRVTVKGGTEEQKEYSIQPCIIPSFIRISFRTLAVNIRRWKVIRF